MAGPSTTLRSGIQGEFAGSGFASANLHFSNFRRRNGTRVPHISRFVRDVGGNSPENYNRGNALFPSC
jgi:hypothetical protein